MVEGGGCGGRETPSYCDFAPQKKNEKKLPPSAVKCDQFVGTRPRAETHPVTDADRAGDHRRGRRRNGPPDQGRPRTVPMSAFDDHCQQALRASLIDAERTRCPTINFWIFSISGAERRNSGHPDAIVRAEDAMRDDNGRQRAVWGGGLCNEERVARDGAKIQIISAKSG